MIKIKVIIDFTANTYFLNQKLIINNISYIVIKDLFRISRKEFQGGKLGFI